MSTTVSAGLSAAASIITTHSCSPLRYRGYIYDSDTGLYYLQSRYYAPAIGRFINADAFSRAADVVEDLYASVKYNIKQKAEEFKNNNPKSYTVYFLKDQLGSIQYVGRVKTENYASRMQYHYRTKGLVPVYAVSGLPYAEARGLEEIGMICCHTINRGSYYNNQIHGISIFNRRPEYMSAAEDYLRNKAEDALLDLLS